MWHRPSDGGAYVLCRGLPLPDAGALSLLACLGKCLLVCLINRHSWKYVLCPCSCLQLSDLVSTATHALPSHQSQCR